MQHAKKYVLVDPNMYRPSMPEKSLSLLDSEIERTLSADIPDDVKAKLYTSTLKRFKAYDDTMKPQVEKKSLEAELLESMPATQQYKAKRIMRHLKDNPEASWTDKGELIYRQSTIPNSDIVDLVSDALKTKSIGEPPAGWEEFAKALKSSSAPEELVANIKSRNIIKEPADAVKKQTTPIAKRVKQKIKKPRWLKS